jgi:hypothetical protein
MTNKRVTVAIAADSDGGFGAADYSFVFSNDIRNWGTSRMRRNRKKLSKKEVVKKLVHIVKDEVLKKEALERMAV